MLSPIFKLLTKRLRKGQVSLNQLARIVGEVFSGLGDMKRFNMRISLFSIVRKTLEDEVIRFIKLYMPSLIIVKSGIWLFFVRLTINLYLAP